MKSFKFPAALLVFFLIFSGISAQNLIGYKAMDIRKYMKENQKEMVFQSFVYNNTFKYLKYTDRSDNQTLMFFLTADSLCKSLRLVCDNSLKALKIKELNSMYKKAGNNLWIETKNGRDYLVELKEEEWSFNITISQKD